MMTFDQFKNNKIIKIYSENFNETYKVFCTPIAMELIVIEACVINIKIKLHFVMYVKPPFFFEIKFRTNKSWKFSAVEIFALGLICIYSISRCNSIDFVILPR